MKVCLQMCSKMCLKIRSKIARKNVPDPHRDPDPGGGTDG